jgi:hypothetical protein
VRLLSGDNCMALWAVAVMYLAQAFRLKTRGPGAPFCSVQLAICI